MNLDKKYRATKLWNDAIRSFRFGLPTRRHWRQLKPFDETFSGKEAVDWVVHYLRQKPDLGSHISRSQAVRLLGKFQDHGLFVTVGSESCNIKDDNTLFRFCQLSPSKVACTPLALKNKAQLSSFCLDFNESPYASKTRKEFSKDRRVVALSFRQVNEENNNDQQDGFIVEQKHALRDEEFFVPSAQLVARPVSDVEVHDISRLVLLARLRELLKLDTLDTVLEAPAVSGEMISKNCWLFSSKGLCKAENLSDDLPKTILESIKCLGNWPWHTQATHVGFERDVFYNVVDFFGDLKSPLIPLWLLRFLLFALKRCEIMDLQEWSQANKDSDSNILVAEIPNISDNVSLVKETLNNKTSNGEDTSGYHFETEFGTGLPTTRLIVAPASERKMPALPLSLPCTTASSAISHLALAASVGNNITSTPFTPYQQDLVTPSLRTNGMTTVQEDDGLEHYFTTAVRVSPLSEQQAGVTLSEGKVPSIDVHLDDLFPPTSNVNEPMTPEDKERLLFSLPGLVKSPELLHRLRNNQKLNASSTNSYLMQTPAGVPRRGFLQPCSNAPRTRSSFSVAHSLQVFQPAGCRNSIAAPLGANGGEQSVSAGISNTQLQRAKTIFLSEAGRQRTCEVFHLACLLLPSKNRRHLQLLLRVMHKMDKNRCLHLDPLQHHCNRSMVLHHFYRCIASCDQPDISDQDALKLAAFFMDYNDDVFATCAGLIDLVQQRVDDIRRSKISYSADESEPLVFCEQISTTKFDQQKETVSSKALADLLDSIVVDENLKDDVRRKRLLKFKKSYPGLFARRFPTNDSFDALFPSMSVHPLKQAMQKLKRPRFHM